MHKSDNNILTRVNKYFRAFTCVTKWQKNICKYVQTLFFRLSITLVGYWNEKEEKKKVQCTSTGVQGSVLLV
jgi:hypothetical protein